ncbi:MAG: hypothetical protein ACRDHW_00270 [Ktedonobacteraceae bacterium]
MPTKRLKNASARLTTRPIDTIQSALASHGAKAISLDYEQGQAIALAFVLDIGGDRHAFRMPARLQNVLIKLYGNRRVYTETQRNQAYVTAWANIRDWVTAQLAMIDIGLVKMEEVFLPYMMISENKTVFDVYEQQQFQLKSGEK